MKRIILFSTAMMIAVFALPGAARAQADETPRVEVGLQFSSLSFTRVVFSDTHTEPGFGGRITYNLNDQVALEAEGNFFPKKNFASSTAQGGRAIEGLFGVKVGKRFERFGIFGKARPGFVIFTNAITEINALRVESGGELFVIPDLEFGAKTHFATDVGGVIEIYHSRRLATRFDIGDTIIRYGERPGAFFSGQPGGGVNIFTHPAETLHNFQFSAGVSFRF